MSFEVLLLLFVFVALPLLEQLVRNARTKRERAGQPEARQAPPRPPAPARQEPPEWDADQGGWDADDVEGEDEVVVQVLPPPLPPPVPATRPAPPVRRAPVVVARPAVPREVLRARQAREARLRRAAASASAGDQRLARTRRRRSRLAAELAHPAGLRRAVVFMTVLGPCRANEPYS